MKSVPFHGSTIEIGKNQPEYNTIHAAVLPGAEGEVIMCFELTDEEVAEVVRTKQIYHSRLTFNDKFQPMKLTPFLEDIATMPAGPSSPFFAIASAVQVLKEALKNDPDFYYAYQSNIAMPFVDRFNQFGNECANAGRKSNITRDEVHQLANKAAKDFLNLLISDEVQSDVK